jgi:cell division septal protein FtsQ
MKKIIFWIIILSGVLVFSLSRVKIKHVNCATQFESCPEDYQAKLQYLISKNIFIHPTQKDLADLKRLTDVRNVTFTKTFPFTVNIYIEKRTAIGILNNFLSDEQGVLFAPAGASTLPKITIDKEFQLGMQIDDKLRAVLQTLALLRQTISQPFSVKSYQGETLELSLDSGMELVLNANNTPKGWNDSLQLIFTRSRIDGKVPRKIDLRFNNPIISY